MKTEVKNQSILSASIIGISLIISVVLFVSAWRSNYNTNQVITVTGSADLNITSDLGILRGTLSALSGTAMQAYQKLQEEMPILLKYLNSKGFPQEEIAFSPINNYPNYRLNSNGYSTGVISSYNYSQRIEISTNDVNKIHEISLEIASLINKGVNFQIDMPQYYYTKLDELKVEVQALAAKNAMVRAEKIASATNRELGPLRDARMGVLQITPVLSTEVSDYGINDLSTIEKKITAVVTGAFVIK
ncbi:MAG: SIMPL domain-containing protein [Ignavibacteriales bacterium CG_4_9_14_3_um_filter_30_11]|nr:MAG: SIMPL domain-containing protein [Ignavibacteriales bacterium CG_4_9_14_3_um_filter_30_11]